MYHLILHQVLYCKIENAIKNITGSTDKIETQMIN